MATDPVHTTERRDVPSALGDRLEPPRRGRRWIGWVVTLVVLGAAGGGAWWWLSQPSTADASTTQAAALKYAAVQQTDVVATTELSGTLGRQAGDPILSRLSGILTSSAPDGTIVKQGDVLFTVNDSPVVLLYGNLPAWRTMQRNVDGADVQQLETDLTALGYNSDKRVTVDQNYTYYTMKMVERWETAVGASNDGVVNFGEVVFLPGPVRIDSTSVAIGASVNSGTPVLTTSSSDVEVTANLPSADQDKVQTGNAVSITLPDGSTTQGTIADIGATATSSNSGDTLPLTITLNDPSVAGTLDQAPVDVYVVTDQVKNTLAVPVTSLLALAEGGYAVQVDDGGGATHLVPVTPGLYGDSGLVQITAQGLKAGDQVVVP